MPRETAAENRGKAAAHLCPSLLKALHERDIDKIADKIVRLNGILDRIGSAFVRKDYGLVVYVREGQYARLPLAIRYAASYIEEDLGWEAYVHKNRDGRRGRIKEGTWCKLANQEWLPTTTPPHRPTWHEHLLSDEL